MSKGGVVDLGPAASSFESPSKVGWLQKHGGSGMSSHWRKRWFVADHHYLFYYKGANDKKPVGIVCLPDYQACYKAETKGWKKQNVLVLSTQEQDSSEGTSAKNYVLSAESEEEMKDWIRVLTEEIKPMIGENRYANGFSGGKSSSGKGGGGGGGKQKKGKGETSAVDDKALDDVTAMAVEAPKLTHLTTSRPKVPRGRRLPKKYAVFHEDDSRPEADSPPETPDLSRASEPSPLSSSPAESPSTHRKKGQKPTAPLLPTPSRPSIKVQPKTPPTPPAKVVRADSELNNVVEPESPGASTQKLKFSKPLPPKKPAKDKPDVNSTEPDESPTPSKKQAPAPPAKPSKEGTLEKMESSTAFDNILKPSPIKKPRPQPPIKPRTGTTVSQDSTTAAATQAAESASQVGRPMPAPRPVPRKRTITPQASPSREVAAVNKEMVVTKEEAKPVAVKEPPPPVMKDTVTKPPPPVMKDTVTKPPPPVMKDTKPPPPPPAMKETKPPPPAMKETKPPPPAMKETKPPPTAAPEKENKPDIPEKEANPSVQEEIKPATTAAKEPDIPEKEEKPTPGEEMVPEEAAVKPLPEVKEVKEGKAVEEAVVKATEEEVSVSPKDTEENLVKAEMVELKDEQEQLPKPDSEDEVKEDKSEDESGGDTYEVMDMGEEKDNSLEKEVKQDDEYEIMSFNTSQNGAKEKDKSAIEVAAAEAPNYTAAPGKVDQHDKVVADFLPKAPGKINQYDEVAGDFLPTPPGKVAGAVPPPKAPGKVNQYDEVAGDFLPPKYKTKSPSQDASPDLGIRVSPAYEKMEPAGPASRAASHDKHASLDGDYVPMKEGVIIVNEKESNRESGDTSQYEDLDGWTNKAPKDDTYDVPPSRSLTQSYGDYDVPKSLGNTPVHSPLLVSGEAETRQGVISSSGSTSSAKSDSQSKTRSGSGNEIILTSSEVDSGERKRRASSNASKKSGDGSMLTASTLSDLERDSLGYTKVKQDGVERINSVSSVGDRRGSGVPSEIIPKIPPINEANEMPQTVSVSETLKQAKEVLRLAKVVRAEAEQMRDEARRELSIAKKDRHDAMLLKKNAAEILRMAKERLGSSTK